MKLEINGETRRFDHDSIHSVEQLLDELDLQQRRGLAVAVNDQVVPRGRWDQPQLQPGDRVELIRATQGG